MSLPARIVTLLVAFAAVVVGAVFLVVDYIAASPPTVHYTASGGVVNVMLQEDPQNNDPNNPDWVSYYVQDPQTKQWVHTTLFTIPKNTTINVTILGYDGCTPPRNNFWSQVQLPGNSGGVGGKITVQQFADTGKPVSGPTGQPQTMSTLDGWAHCAVGHTFAIPSMHVFVPVASPDTTLFNKAPCSVSPCTSGPYSQETFSFKAPDHTGVYRWQCFVPCGGGYLDGNGGPMQTIGYMMGQVEVTA